jgi:hypothetical protein
MYDDEPMIDLPEEMQQEWRNMEARHRAERAAWTESATRYAAEARARLKKGEVA